MILLTLNPGEPPAVPSAQEHPPSEIVTVAMLMYASLLISLLAAFTAMLGKQWLNRYLRNAGGSMIERCGDRQRKCDGLQKWPFHFFVESLPVMLQIALLLLACGLCRHMTSINTPVASVLITLTVLGVLFYLGVVIAGTSSYECPFQTPASTALRNIWKKIRSRAAVALFLLVAAGTSLYKCLTRSLALAALLLEDILFLCQIPYVSFWLPLMERYYRLPIAQPTPQEPTPWLASLHGLWENIKCEILRKALRLPQTLPPHTIPDTTLVTLRKMNANDVRCVSWILWSITDPEALDAAIRLAGTIRWFEDGIGVKPPYHLIITTFRACFNSTGMSYPGLEDRAYWCAQAVLWIQIRAICVSEEFARGFPLPIVRGYKSLDHDLNHLLKLYNRLDDPYVIWEYIGNSQVTPTNLQWTSNALLQLSWARRNAPIPEGSSLGLHFLSAKIMHANSPLNARLNRLLASCIFLDGTFDEELLTIQDKSCAMDNFCPPSCSFRHFLVTVWNRSYLKYPEQSFQQSAPPTVTATSSYSSCVTYPSWANIPST